jgi:transcription antitermination factor NusA-like protein
MFEIEGLNVKSPLCEICLKNYPLICNNCQEKIKNGEITELGVKVARALINLEDLFPSIKHVTFKRVFQIDGVIIVLVGKGDVRRIIGASRRILRQLEEDLNSKVRLVEESRNPQHILSDLIRPVKILGVNTIWLPDNSFERIVRISEREREKIPLTLKQLENAIYEMANERIRIAFD